MGFLNWLQENWFTLLQSVGITAGLFFSGASHRLEARSRHVSNQLEITKQHREIWMLLYSRPDLKRVTDANADLAAFPVTTEERIFVNMLIRHLATSHRAAQARMFKLPTELHTDIRAFFSRPIPRAVWEMMRPFQNADFVAFVERYQS